MIPSVGITAGLRYDHYNDFGGTVNPRVGAVWRFPRNFSGKLLYGRAFRAPTGSELYFQLPTAFIGNPDARPSTIHTIEEAITYKGRRLRAGATYFSNIIRNFLVPTRPTTLEGILLPATFVNGAGFNVVGVEFELRRTFGLDHAIFANYVFERVQDRQTGRRAEGTPAHLGTVGFTVGAGRYLSITPSVIARGERPRSALDSRSPVSGYAIANVNLRLKQLLDSVEVSGTINNLFD